MDIVSIASQFVDLALKYEKWGEVTELPEDEIRVLFEIVSAAGFDIKEVVTGKLLGNILDQDGSRTGRTYPINSLCPFKVMKEDGDHYFATGWLDCAFRRVIFSDDQQSGDQQEESRDQLIKTIVSDIERSVPLEPIQLTPEGDMLREYPPSIPYFAKFEYFVEHPRDDCKLGSCVGVHKYCGGWMDRNRATETHDALVCRSCHLRILFPKEVETYGDLRKALAIKDVPVPA